MHGIEVFLDQRDQAIMDGEQKMIAIVIGPPAVGVGKRFSFHRHPAPSAVSTLGVMSIGPFRVSATPISSVVNAALS